MHVFCTLSSVGAGMSMQEMARNLLITKEGGVSMAEIFSNRMSDIGKNIRAIRTGIGMSQTDLADAMDTSRNAVSRWESGERVMKLDSLLKLAEVFDVSPSEILDAETPGGGEWEGVIADIRKLPEDDRKYFLRTVRTLLCGMKAGICT